MSLTDLLDPKMIISTLGLLGVVGAVFAESGLFFGFFLPGDSLLFTAGFFASQGFLFLPTLLVGVLIAAILGDSVGYSFGKYAGQALFDPANPKRSRFLKLEYLEKGRLFYEKHGAKAIIFARFVPVVRTFAPIVAGAVGMRYSTFIRNNVIGGTIWSIGFTTLGYVFGNTIPHADRYITPIVIAIIIISILPGIVHIVRARK